MKRIVSIGVVGFGLLLLSIVGFGAGRSEVADALMRGDKAAARKLVEQRVDVNAPQADGATALHWAVFQSDKEMVDLLLRAKANPSVSNREGATPLWLASVNGDAAIIAALLDAGANANEPLPLGRTPLMAASRTGNVDAMKVLVDHGANVNAKETIRGTTPLMWAADEGHAPAIQFLIQHGADIKARSNLVERGRGPALGKSNDPRKQVAAQGAALAAGQASPDLGTLRAAADGAAAAPVQGQRGAAGQGQRGGGRGGQANANAGAAANAAADVRMVRIRPMLAQQSDSAAVVDADRRNPMDGGALTPLIYAVRSNDLDSVKVLLAAGADINQVSGYGWSPLLVATQNRYYKLGAYLLDHGADVNLANKGMWTPLYLATDNRNIESGDYPVRKGDMDHLDYIKILIDKGANVNARIKDSTQTRTVFTNQWLDENGATAFLRASQSGDLVLMKLLLAHGADPKDCNRTGSDGAAGGIRNWLGRRNHLRVVGERHVRGRQAAAGSGTGPECPGRHRTRGASWCGSQGTPGRGADPCRSRRKAGREGLRKHRQPRRQTGDHDLAAGRLRRWSRPSRSAIRDCPSGNWTSPS